MSAHCRMQVRDCFREAILKATSQRCGGEGSFGVWTRGRNAKAHARAVADQEATVVGAQVNSAVSERHPCQRARPPPLQGVRGQQRFRLCDQTVTNGPLSRP